MRKVVTAGFAGSVLALVGIGWLSYSTISRLVGAMESVAHTHQVRALLAGGSATLTEAETAQRAYLLTGKDEFLTDCRAAQSQILSWQESIRQLTADNAEQQRRIDRLEGLIAERLEILNNRISIRRQEGLEAAATAVAQREGKEAMDRVQAVLAEMDATEARLLDERRAAAGDSARSSIVVILIGGTVTCVFGLAALLAIQRGLRLRERADLEIRQSRALLQSIMDNAPAVVFLKDLEGRYLFVNRRFTELAGKPREQIVGRTGFDLFKKELAQAAREHDLRVQTAGEALSFEETVLHPDGPHTHLAVKFPLMDSSGRVYATGAVSTDVTERKRAQEELDRFFGLSLDFLCIAASDGYFKRASPAVTDILGWSVEEFLATPFIELVHPDDREATLKEVERQTVRGERVLNFENRYRCKDGSWRILSWRSMPQPGGLMYATARDVTEQKQAQEKIARLNENLERRATQLELANKELESFSYSVSHDLRAPLRHIDGFVGLLERQCTEKLDERAKRYLKIIAESARQMGSLIDDLLVFSRMGRSEMKRSDVNLDALANEVIEKLQHDLDGRNVEWKLTALPVVQGDAAMLRLVLANLIGNAVKYTRPRNPAVIEIGCKEETADETVFFVRDNGVGFDMQYEHKLFGVFQRLHSADQFEGTGIGLANVRRIIQRHGGRTWAEGKLDAGATVYYSLPKQLVK